MGAASGGMTVMRSIVWATREGSRPEDTVYWQATRATRRGTAVGAPSIRWWPYRFRRGRGVAARGRQTHRAIRPSRRADGEASVALSRARLPGNRRQARTRDDANRAEQETLSRARRVSRCAEQETLSRARRVSRCAGQETLSRARRVSRCAEQRPLAGRPAATSGRTTGSDLWPDDRQCPRHGRLRPRLRLRRRSRRSAG